MLKILGKKSNYNDQTNDGSYNLLDRYKAESKAVNCFWNACAFGLEIKGWIDPKSPMWGKIQFPDYALMIQYNTKHYHLYRDAYKNFDPKKARLNEFYRTGVIIANNVIFNNAALIYSDNPESVTFDIITEQIKRGYPVVTSSHLYGGHFICHHAIDTANDRIGYADSYNKNWLNWWSRDEFNKMVKLPIGGVTKDYCKIWFAGKKSFTFRF